MGEITGDRWLTMVDVDGSRFSAVFFIRSATKHHKQWQQQLHDNR